MPTDYKFRRDIVRFGEMLHGCGFIAATDGNLSVRLDNKRVLVTPTGMSKGMMNPSDLVIVDMSGRKLKGRREATNRATGFTREARERFKQRLLAVTADDLKRVTHAYLLEAPAAQTTVAGPDLVEAARKERPELFEVVAPV